jgi:hypothetical protein
LQAIDTVVKKVDEMQAQVAQLDWPIFEKEYADDWGKVVEEFAVSQADCTKASQEVVDSCFK